MRQGWQPEEFMVNLHVNLILDSERRSSSRVSRKFLITASAVFVILIFLSFAVTVLVGARLARQRFDYAEREKKQIEPVFYLVSDLRQKLINLQDLTNAIGDWAQTRPDWPHLLSGIQAAVPPNIQLTRFTVNESINYIDNVPVRIVTLYMQGKTAGARSEIDVQQFEKNLKTAPPFAGIMEQAEVKQFEAARSQNGQNLRIFDMECRFKPLKLFQPPQDKPQSSK